MDVEEKFEPVNGLGADGGPPGLHVREHGLEGVLVGFRSLVLQLLPGLHGLVVGRLLGRKRFLELAVFVQPDINNITFRQTFSTAFLDYVTY